MTDRLGAERRLQLRGLGDWSEWLRDTVGSLKATAPDIIATFRALDVPLATLNYDGRSRASLRNARP